LTPAIQARALMHAASAFLSTLLRRSQEAVPAVREVPEAPLQLVSSGLRSPGVENRCPVCQARFRGVRICSRCGADLEPLMRLSVKAWQLRQSARQALGAGDMDGALEFATAAQAVQSTENGEALRLLAAWLLPGRESMRGVRRASLPAGGPR
jgi:hypothetical protein